MTYTKWWIAKGNSYRLDGRLIVTSNEPEPDRYIEGPFDDHLEAFDRMQELQSKENVRRATVETVTLLALLILGGALIYNLPT